MATPWALAAALTNAAGVWRGLYSHRLSHPVLRIALHTAPFRGSAIVPTILSFLSRALKRPSTLIYEGIPQVGLLLMHSAEGGHLGNPIHRSTWNAHPPKSRCRILHSPGPLPVSVLDSTPCVLMLFLRRPRHKGEVLCATHRSLWRTRDRGCLPRRARRAGVGAAPRSRYLAPAPQRRRWLHLRSAGRDLRRSAGARGYRRVGGIRCR